MRESRFSYFWANPILKVLVRGVPKTTKRMRVKSPQDQKELIESLYDLTWHPVTQLSEKNTILRQSLVVDAACVTQDKRNINFVFWLDSCCYGYPKESIRVTSAKICLGCPAAFGRAFLQVLHAETAEEEAEAGRAFFFFFCCDEEAV